MLTLYTNATLSLFINNAQGLPVICGFYFDSPSSDDLSYTSMTMWGLKGLLLSAIAWLLYIKQTLLAVGNVFMEHVMVNFMEHYLCVRYSHL